MSDGYHFKYRLGIAFDEPDDVISFMNMLVRYSDIGHKKELGFHPAMVEVGGRQELCLVDSDQVWYNADEECGLHTCGQDYAAAFLCDFIDDVRLNIPGTYVTGYVTIISQARDVEFIFFKDSILIDSLSDDDLAEGFKRELDERYAKEE